ncbi:MAG: hypothetical protein AAF829_13010 [Pseudomonadota bacterium]
MGWDEMVEDVMGVNLRGLRTIWMAIRDPKRLFTAARSSDWQGRQFGPSLRVFLFILAVILFFQFIWADPQSQVAEAFREVVGTLDEIDPEFGDEKTVLEGIEVYVVVYPLILVILSFLFSLLVRIWGNGTPLLARVRLYFAAVIPSAFLGIFSTLILAAVPLDQSTGPTLAALVIGGVVDALTTFRGLAPMYAFVSRLWRALLFGLISMTALAATSIAATVVTLTYISFMLGLESGLAVPS